MNDTIDAAVIGGGPAGLQAALTLGRMHRTVAVFDSGSYRNDPADAMHNLVGHDGQSPAGLRAAAHADLAAYDTVRVVDASVETVSGSAGGFSLSTSAGEVTASRVILATGMRDALPTIPGLADAFGTVAAHCPFCHGHEYAGTPVGMIGPGMFLDHMTALMTPIASRLIAFPDGFEVDQDVAERLRMLDVEVVEGPVVSVVRDGDRATVTVGDASWEVGGVLVRLESQSAAPHLAQLGVETSEPIGAALVDPYGRTTVPGVFAAGDIAQLRGTPGPMWSVANAIATGAAAGTSVVQELAMDHVSRLAARP